MTAGVLPAARRLEPLLINPEILGPAQQRAEVNRAMARRYPDRIWLHRNEPHELDVETGALEPLSKARFRAMVPEAAVVLGWAGKGEDRHEVSLAVPRPVVDDAYHHPAMARELRYVRHAPWIEPDGRLVVDPGYDETTGIWLHWPEAPCDPAEVSDEDVVDVFDRLLDLRFANECDRAAARALFLRLVVNLEGHPSPMGLVSAEEAEAGKTLLARCLGIAALGHEPTTSPLPTSSVEASYTIGALVRRQPDLIWFDNIATGSTLGGSDFHAILTASGAVESRVVGSGALGSGDPTRIVFLATGNRLEVDAEQARRTLPVRLVKRSAGTPFRTPDLPRWIARDRRRILSVLLRLHLDWHEAGRPAPVRSLGSFEEWSRLVGGPLCHRFPVAARTWLAPAARPLVAVDRDLVAAFEAWPVDEAGAPRAIPSKVVLAALVDRLQLPALLEVAGEGNERARSTRLGVFLTTTTRRSEPVAGWVLTGRHGRNGLVYWPARDPGDRSRGGSASKDGVDTTSAVPPVPAVPDSDGSIVRDRDRGDLLPGGQSPPDQSRGYRGYRGSAVFADDSCGTWSRETHLEVPQDDPAYDAIAEMAERGLRVDADLWLERVEAATAGLAELDDEASASRRENLELYGMPVFRAALEGRVRARWWLQGPGRLTCRDPFLHGITKSYGVREAVVPEPGCRFVVGDWHAAHIAIAAGLSRDLQLLAELASGDFYDHAAATLAPELSGDVARSVAKRAALSTLNGAGAERVAEQLREAGIALDASDARRRQVAWFDRYPDLTAFLGALTRRSWLSPLGRAVEMPAERGDHAIGAWTWQAVEADALRLVLQRFAHPIVFTFYDEVVAEVPEADADRAAADLRAAMDEALVELAHLPAGITTSKVATRRSWGVA